MRYLNTHNRSRHKGLRFKNKRKEMLKKSLITIALLMLFRLLNYIPTPFTNLSLLDLKGSNLGALNIANMFSGGAFKQFTLMATGISSYISASIIVQLLTYVSKRLDEISKGANGQKIMKHLIIVLGLILSFITSLIFTNYLQKASGFLSKDAWWVYLLIALFHSLGTFIAIIIGEAITEKGYGNGVSLLISINIILGLPQLIKALGSLNTGAIITTVLLSILMVLIIIRVESSDIKLKLRYTKNLSRMRGINQSSVDRLPIKLNLAGVMPVIITSSTIQLFSFIFNLSNNKVSKSLQTFFSNKIAYFIAFSLLIVLFSYVYSFLIFNPREIAENLQKAGGVIIGIRPGKDTTKYLDQLRKQLSKFSGIYLILVSFIPLLISLLFNFNGLQATSIIILVGTITELLTQIENDYKMGLLSR